MYKLFTFVLLLPFVVPPAQAQETDAAKRLQEMVRKADKASMGGMVNYVHADILYQEALALAPDDPELNLKMGLCQLNGPFRHKALPYLLKAAEGGMAYPPLYYLVGYAHQLNGQWDEAVAAYEKHNRSYVAEPGSDPLYTTANRRIAECRNGARLSASPRDWKVENAGERINSMFADYGALPTLDGNTIWFTSRRPGASARVNKATREYFEDIHVVRRSGAEWGPVEVLSTPVNSPGNDATVCLAHDGRTMLIYRDDSKGKGNILQCSWNGQGWSAPTGLGSHINTPHHEGSAWITADGQWLYFTSDDPEESMGGQDIFRSRWDPTTNSWGMAENLGPDVNTNQDEEGVFVTTDGNTIYFSSKGHDSMGGYDIFRSTYVNGRWSKPENLGVPVNSPDDDVFFVLSADGRTGWFSSTRPGGFGEDDIYTVTLPVEDTATPARP